MTEELQAISVGLRVNLSQLDADLQAARLKAQNTAGKQYKLNFSVGKIDTTAAENEIKRLLAGKIVVNPTISASRASVREFQRALQTELKSSGPIPLAIKANLAPSEVKRIRDEIVRALGSVPINITAQGGGGKGGATAITPHERAVNTDIAAKIARAKPGGTTVASGPAGAVAERPTRAPRPRVVSVPSQTVEEEPVAKKILGPRPRGFGPPIKFVGQVGDSRSITYVTNPKTGKVSVRQPPERGLAGRLVRSAGQRLSPDEMRKARALQPETPEEIEYASRPTRVSLPLDAQGEFEQEKRGSGVRGASRSGARQRNEPVLLPSDHLANDIRRDDDNDTAVAARTAATRKAARGSKAYYGTPVEHAGFRSRVEGIQFYKFDPRLGQAFEALQGGELGEARELLRGFSGELAGVDPRKRKKFFRLFRNAENAPPEVLEKHAALQSLFRTIAMQEADLRVGNVEAEVKAFAKPKGPQSGWPESTVSDYQELLDKQKFVRKWRFDLLRGVAKRAGGGPVRGALPVFGRGLSGIRPEHFGQVGDKFTSLYGFPFELRRVPIDSIRTYHDTKPERIDEYAALAKTGSQIPPIVLGPRNTVQDGHHRLAAAKRLGHKDMLAYVFEGKEGDYPEALLKKLGIVQRADGGPVAGGLMARRLAHEAALKDATLVGEKKPETYVSKSGHVEIVGEKGPEIRQFPEDGKIIPYVPEWVRRMDKNAKDFTKRAAGGPVRGQGGAFRSFVPGEGSAIASGLLSAASSANVQRVFVVNFPAATGTLTSSPQGQALAAGPLRFGNSKEADKFAQQLGGHIGKEFQRALKEHEGPVGPDEPGGPSSPTGKGTTLVAKSGPLTATEAEEIRIQQSREQYQGRKQLALTSAGVSSQVAEAAARSIGPATGQLLSTALGPRGAIIERRTLANLAVNEAKSAQSRVASLRAQQSQVSINLGKADTPEKIEDLTKKLNDLKGAEHLAGDYSKELTDDAVNLGKSVVGPADIVKNFATNLLGIAAGTTVFSASLQAVQFGLSVVSQLAAPAIEGLTGFGNVSAGVTKNLAAQIRQNNGAVQSTFALTAAQSGLSKSGADLIANSIEQRASTEAGNQALHDTIDLLHTAQAVQNQNANAPGGERGLSQYTGGLFGTGIFGIPGTAEQIAKPLTGLPVPGPGGAPSQTYGSLAGGFGAITIPTALAGLSKDAQASLQDLQVFNGQIVKGGAAFKLVAGTDIPAMGDDIKQAAASAASIFSPDLANEIKSGQLALIDSTGKVVTNADDWATTLRAINKSFTTPDVGELVDQLKERIIPAQLSQFRASAGISRLQNSAAAFLGSVASPTPGLTGGPAFGAGLVGVSGGKADAAAAAAAGKYRTIVGGAVTDVNAMIEQGHQDLLNLVPPDEQKQFTDILNAITATGKQISAIQTGVTQEQSNYAVAEYNNQLRIARRSLQDAKDLQAGIAGETRDTVGGIEGMNTALNRQLQLLGFELQQREINFKVATAGFAAPGLTGQERAARIDEAKQEAAFAQKQLDIQKQLAGNQFKEVKIEASRSVTDLVAQVGLLEQGRTVTLDTAAAGRALDVLNKKQELLTQNAGTYISEGVQVVTAASQAASEVQQQTGKAFSYILNQTANAWGLFGSQAQAILDALSGSAPGGGTRSTSGKTGAFMGASGLLFDTSGPTDLTVGEAGREQVAVLRNPRQMTFHDLMGQTQLMQPKLAQPETSVPSSGGNISVTVIVTGNTISKDTDLDQLADTLVDKVADRVETKMGRKAKLLGFSR